MKIQAWFSLAPVTRRLPGDVLTHHAFVWGGLIFFVVTPRLRRAERATEVIAVEGPVTELIVARVTVGRGPRSEVRWYRVEGVLFCPFMVDGGSAKPGQRVKFEIMISDGRHDDGMLMNFETF